MMKWFTIWTAPFSGSLSKPVSRTKHCHLDWKCLKSSSTLIPADAWLFHLTSHPQTRALCLAARKETGTENSRRGGAFLFFSFFFLPPSANDNLLNGTAGIRPGSNIPLCTLRSKPRCFALTSAHSHGDGRMQNNIQRTGLLTVGKAHATVGR